MSKLGDAVRAARRRHGMTLRECGELAGISAVYLCDIELGKRIPPIRTVVKIAHGLGVNAECWGWLSIEDEIGSIFTERLKEFAKYDHPAADTARDDAGEG